MQRIDQFFLRMAAIFPYTWAGQFVSEEAVHVAKQEWLEGLEDLTDLQVQKGLNACRKNDNEFPPSIPKFRKLSLPTDRELGILPTEEAYQLFINQDFSLPILREVKQYIDGWSFRMATIKEARQMFKNAYQICLDKQQFKGKYLE